ncbi:MAG: hypothetical protein FJ405_01075 [Verrucomicrobia bacterium]|nr:hypothetical protein [Verrucomicrobiota bacterium]
MTSGLDGFSAAWSIVIGLCLLGMSLGVRVTDRPARGVGSIQIWKQDAFVHGLFVLSALGQSSLLRAWFPSGINPGSGAPEPVILTEDPSLFVAVGLIIVPGFCFGALLRLIIQTARAGSDPGRSFTGRFSCLILMGVGLGYTLSGMLDFTIFHLSVGGWMAVGLTGLSVGIAWLNVGVAGARDLKEGERSMSDTVACGGQPFGGAERIRAQHPASRVMAFGSGFVVLIHHIGWSSGMSSVLGSFAAAVFVVTSVSLFALGAGSWMGGRILNHRICVFQGIALGQVSALVLTLIALQWMEDLPYHYLQAFSSFAGGPVHLMAVRFIMVALLMGLPCAALGVFLRLSLMEDREVDADGRTGIASLHAWSCAGALAGSWITGLGLVPLFGSQASLMMATVLHAGMAAWALYLANGVGAYRVHREHT